MSKQSETASNAAAASRSEIAHEVKNLGEVKGIGEAAPVGLDHGAPPGLGAESSQAEREPMMLSFMTHKVVMPEYSTRDAAIRAARGSLADLPGSVESFLRERHECDAT